MNLASPKVPTLDGSPWQFLQTVRYRDVDREDRVGVYCENADGNGIPQHELWLCGSFVLLEGNWIWRDVFTTGDRVEFGLRPQAEAAGSSTAQVLADDAPFDLSSSLEEVAPATSAADASRYNAELRKVVELNERRRTKATPSCPRCPRIRRSMIRLEKASGMLHRLRAAGVQEISLAALAERYRKFD